MDDPEKNPERVLPDTWWVVDAEGVVLYRDYTDADTSLIAALAADLDHYGGVFLNEEEATICALGETTFQGLRVRKRLVDIGSLD